MADKTPSQPKDLHCPAPACNKVYKTQGHLDKHIKDKQHQAVATDADQGQDAAVANNEAVKDATQEELNIDNSVLEEAKEDQDLYDQLDRLAEDYQEPEENNEHESKEKYKEKIARIVEVIKKKLKVIKTMKKEKDDLSLKVDRLEASGSRCHDCKCKEDIIKDRDTIIDKKEKQIKSDEKKKLEQAKGIQKMKENHEKAIEENN